MTDRRIWPWSKTAPVHAIDVWRHRRRAAAKLIGWPWPWSRRMRRNPRTRISWEGRVFYAEG